MGEVVVPQGLINHWENAAETGRRMQERAEIALGKLLLTASGQMELPLYEGEEHEDIVA